MVFAMDDRQRREQIRRRKRKKAMQRKRMLRNMILAGFALILLVLGFLIFWKPVHKQVKLEVGETLELNDFLKKEKKRASFVTDMNEIDLGSVYNIQYSYVLNFVNCKKECDCCESWFKKV